MHNMEIIEITSVQATHIIENRAPKGSFYHFDGNTYVGIDNRTGEAWVEEFEDKQSCIDWLLGEI